MASPAMLPTPNELDAPGLWFDQSVYDVTVAGCDAVGNGTSQYVFENCTRALFVNNLAAGGTKGFHILGADQVQLWNCTATNHGWAGSSAISTNLPSGDLPETRRP